MSEFDKALEKKTQGNAYFKERKYELAVEEYSAALQMFPQANNPKLFADLINNRSAAYIRLKDYQKSVDDSKLVISHNPNNHKAHFRLLQALMELRKYHESLLTYIDFENRLTDDEKKNPVMNQMKKLRQEIERKFIPMIVNTEFAKNVKLYLSKNVAMVAFTIGMMANNTYVLFTKDHSDVVLIDAPFNMFSAVSAFCERKGGTVHLILSHGHLDHIFDLQLIKKKFGDKCITYVHEGDKKHLDLMSDENAKMFEMFFPMKNIKEMIKNDMVKMIIQQQFHVSIENIKCDVYFQKDVEKLKMFGVEDLLEIIHTPGHSNGCVCIYLKDENWLFSGDTLFRGTTGRTDFFDGDVEVLRESIRKKIYTLPDDCVIFPGHPSQGTEYVTTVGREKIFNIVKPEKK